MEKAYCAACGTMTEVMLMTEGTGVSAEEAARCINCGFKVAYTPSSSPTASPLADLSKTLFERAAIVEDMDAIRGMVRDTLVEHRICDLVDDFANGQVFIQALQSTIHLGKTYEVVILDLQMPTINGLQAASFLRGLEKKHGWSPTPILFFSAVVCDERLRHQFQVLGPAVYLNKANIGAKENLPDRLYSVMTALLPFK